MLKDEIPTASSSIWTRIKTLRTDDIGLLAPKMREAVLALLEDAKSVGDVGGVPFDPDVFETWRPDELQRIYFQQGTTKASTAIYGWHFFGLAVDIISTSREWSVPEAWWQTLAHLAQKHGLDAGYHWKHPDKPHLQWGYCKPSPSDAARELYFGTPDWKGKPVLESDAHRRGLARVWSAVSAA